MMIVWSYLYVLNSLVNDFGFNTVGETAHKIHAANIVEHEVDVRHSTQVLPIDSQLITLKFEE
jgi:hypothetical protein